MFVPIIEMILFCVIASVAVAVLFFIGLLIYSYHWKKTKCPKDIHEDVLKYTGWHVQCEIYRCLHCGRLKWRDFMSM